VESDRPENFNMRRGIDSPRHSCAAADCSIQRSSGPATQTSGKATLSGVVLGPDDKPAPHAAVDLPIFWRHRSHAVHADAHGRFSIANLRGDIYEFARSAKGIFPSGNERERAARQQKKNSLRLIYAREMPVPVKKPVK